ncbi:MAG: PepSY domain-containing protein [Methanobacterium paludis]|nr:PepSY domain-containing protein [Methanobacterium paludis]
MEKTTKILLIACVILVAALSLTVGLVIGNQINNHSVVDTTNNTTPAVNSTVNQSQGVTKSQSVQNTTNKKSSNGIITATQAANLALKYAGEECPGEVWSVNNVELNPYGVYVVEVFNQAEVEAAKTNTPNPADKSMDVDINAHTGAIASGPTG